MTDSAQVKAPNPLAKVSVGIKVDDLAPDEVTRVIGVSPTRAFRKGDLSPKMSVPRPWGVWAVEHSSHDVAEAALAILDVLEPRADSMREVAATWAAEWTIAIFWQPEGGQGGYSLSADMIRRLSMLGSRIDFYFS